MHRSPLIALLVAGLSSGFANPTTATDDALQAFPLLAEYSDYTRDVLGAEVALPPTAFVLVAGTTIPGQRVVVRGDLEKQRIFDQLISELRRYAFALDMTTHAGQTWSMAALAEEALRGERAADATMLLQEASGGSLRTTVEDFFTYRAARRTGMSMAPAQPNVPLAPGPSPPPAGSSGSDPYTTVTGQPNPFASAPSPPPAGTTGTSGSWAGATTGSHGPLSRTPSGAWMLYSQPVCTWLVQLIIDEGFVDQNGAWGAPGGYVIPAMSESGFHLQAYHPEFGKARLQGEAARIVLERKGYLEWDPAHRVWRVTPAYVNFVQYGRPPAQPACPDAVGSPGAAPAGPTPTGACLAVTIEKGPKPAPRMGGPAGDKYPYTCRKLVVKLVNQCDVPIQVDGSCRFAVGHDPTGVRDSKFNRTLAKHETHTQINSGVCESRHVSETVTCSGSVTAGVQTYSWSQSG